MESLYPAGLMWFRRDLRAQDNTALSHALSRCRQVHCVFVLDREILDSLDRDNRRVGFIRDALVELDRELRTLGGHQGCGLIVRHAVAADEIPVLAQQLQVEAVFANHDHDPAAQARDARVRTALAARRVDFHSFKDHVIFEARELLAQAGTPYTVFTPYKRAWLARLEQAPPQAAEISAHAGRLAPRPVALRGAIPALAEIGFEAGEANAAGIPAGASGGQVLLKDFLGRIDRYDRDRDFPALEGPSHLGAHLRFGTVSIRQLVALALARPGQGAATWLSELAWRDFYAQILANFPHVVRGSFKAAYDAIAWEHGPRAKALFAAWCEGRTGYPLVDAAMAQINRTGYMHNRLRMVVASFLTKDLGISWQWGEQYFARKLIDYELASNNGGWQWAASTGCDAQPYFRIFNPVSQSRKFDPDGAFILRYLPQLAGLPPQVLHAPWTANPLELAVAGIELGRDYPQPIVAHESARAATLQRYAVVRGGSGAQAETAVPL